MNSNTRNILLSIIVVLFIILFGIGIGYMFYQIDYRMNIVKEEENPDAEVIDLTASELEDINEEFRKLNFSTVNDYQFLINNNNGQNIFDSDIERYNATIYYIFNEEVWENKINQNYLLIESENGEDEDYYVKLSYVHYKCIEFFNKDFDESKIGEDEFGINYDKGYATIYKSGGGILADTKVVEKRYNSKTYEYILLVDFVDTMNANNIKRKATIKYKIQNNKKVLTSWIYTK